MGGKMDIVKQVEAAEKMAKIEADFVRVKSEVDISQNRFSEQKRRTDSMEGDISELLISKDLFQIKLNAAETECIGQSLLLNPFIPVLWWKIFYHFKKKFQKSEPTGNFFPKNDKLPLKGVTPYKGNKFQEKMKNK